LQRGIEQSEYMGGIARVGLTCDAGDSKRVVFDVEPCRIHTRRLRALRDQRPIAEQCDLAVEGPDGVSGRQLCADLGTDPRGLARGQYEARPVRS
jgi:hypothetical protein